MFSVKTMRIVEGYAFEADRVSGGGLRHHGEVRGDDDAEVTS